MAILSSFCNARGVANGTRTISSVSGAPAGGAATRAEMMSPRRRENEGQPLLPYVPIAGGGGATVS